MNGKHVIIHVGTPKTGTTVIQNFLARNREALEGRGIGYYAPDHRYNLWKGAANADFLLYTVLEEMGVVSHCRNRELLGKECERFSEYCCYHEMVILSEEALWGPHMKYEGFAQALKEKMAALCGTDAIIDIVVYLRRQDTWLLSRWKEGIRSMRSESDDFMQTVENYRRAGAVDYDKLLDRICEAFGEKHVTVRSYDKCSYEKGGVIRDFAYIIGVKNLDELIITRNKVNRAFSMNATEALRLIKTGKVRYDGPWLTILSAVWRFFEYSEVKEKVFPMSYSDRKSLIQRCAEGNRRVEERFLGGTELFSEEVEEYDVWESDPERDLKNAEAIVKLTESILAKKQRHLHR